VAADSIGRSLLSILEQCLSPFDCPTYVPLDIDTIADEIYGISRVPGLVATNAVAGGANATRKFRFGTAIRPGIGQIRAQLTRQNRRS
jgi:hypothetical protein